MVMEKGIFFGFINLAKFDLSSATALNMDRVKFCHVTKTLLHNPSFNNPGKEGFLQTLRKKKNIHGSNRLFLIFSHCFLSLQRQNSSF